MNRDENCERVRRGGGWNFFDAFARLRFRDKLSASRCNDRLGFRLIRKLSLLEQMIEVNKVSP